MRKQQPGRDPQFEQKTVLVVEDDAVQRKAYRLVLAKAGLLVEEVGDGAAALERLRASNHPDIALVVLDVELPDTSGLDLLATIRESHEQRTLPIIIVTGTDALEQRLRGLEDGANDYLIKPVAFAEFVARVRAQLQLVDRWQARMAAVAESRRQMALTLRDINEVDDIQHAARVITSSVEQLADVTGAAFICAQDRLCKGVIAGDLPLTPGSAVPPILRSCMRGRDSTEPLVASRQSLGLGRHGQVAVVPLAVSNRTAGFVVATFDSGLATERADAIVTAISELAALAAPLITPVVDRRRVIVEGRRHYHEILDTGAFTTVFQPIVELASGSAVGFEALTRFDDGTRPDLAFARAEDVGMGVALERATALAAMERAAELPAGCYVSVNFSAQALLDIGLLASLTSPGRKVMIEITEHDMVDDYGRLQTALATVRKDVRIAVDDAGAGYAGLHHMRSLRPDVIKLDRSLVSALDVDRVGRAMIAGMASFAAEAGSTIVAEGIETESERQALVELGVSHGQGFLLGRPSPASTWSKQIPYDRTRRIADCRT